MGLPASGKSTVAQEFVQQGYARLNRDEAGGSLADQIPALDRAVESGASHMVLDNTYTMRQMRAPMLAAAARHGLPVRGVWLDTALEDAQTNAVWRMVSKYGRLLEPAEMRRSRDPGDFGPGVLFRYLREMEPPQLDEGFAALETRPFARAADPARTARAVILWCADAILDGHGALLQRYAREDWRIIRLSWQPEIAAGSITAADAETALARSADRLGVTMDARFCPHPAGPPICWCRKPLPGLGVVMIHAHGLDASRCIYVGEGPQDPGFARRLGFRVPATPPSSSGRSPICCGHDVARPMDLRLTVEAPDRLVVHLREGQDDATVTVSPSGAGVRSLGRALDDAMAHGYGECFWPGMPGGQYLVGVPPARGDARDRGDVDAGRRVALGARVSRHRCGRMDPRSASRKRRPA